jgi:hypothetical protein
MRRVKCYSVVYANKMHTTTMLLAADQSAGAFVNKLAALVCLML